MVFDAIVRCILLIASDMFSPSGKPIVATIADTGSVPPASEPKKEFDTLKVLKKAKDANKRSNSSRRPPFHLLVHE
jgi:hypothetical protein